MINNSNYKTLLTLTAIGLGEPRDSKAVFSNDGMEVFYAGSYSTDTQIKIYKFGISSSSSEIELILTFSSNMIANILKLSADGKTLFIGASSTSKEGKSALYIVGLEPPAMLGSYSMDSQISDFVVSTDSKKALVVRSDVNLLEIIDVSIMTSPTRISQTQFTDIDSQTYEAAALSPDNNILVLAVAYKIYVLDVTDPVNFTLFTSRAITGNMVSFSSDSKTLFIIDTSEWKLQICKVFIDINFGEQYNKPSLTTSLISTSGPANTLALSLDEKTAFVGSSQGLEVFNIINQTSLISGNIVYTSKPVKQVMLSHDGKTIFMSTGSMIKILDAVNMQEISTVNIEAYNFTISLDDKILVIEQPIKAWYGSFVFIDIKDLTSPQIMSTQSQTLTADSIFAVTDNFLILLYQQVIEVYNVSNLKSLDLYTATAVTIQTWMSIAVSSNGKTLYAVGFYEPVGTQQGTTCFHIYDLPDLSNTGSTCDLDLHTYYFMREFRSTISVTADSTLAYVSILNNLYILNITNVSSPSILNFITNQNTGDTWITSLAPSLNLDPGFILTVDTSGSLKLIDLVVYNTVYMSTQSFPIGQESKTKLLPVQRNDAGRYSLLQTNFKLVKVAMYEYTNEAFSIKKSQLALLSWMDFDRENSIYTVTPNSPTSAGSYQIYISASTEVLPSSFSNIVSDGSHLVTALFNADYLDIEGYINLNFSPDQPLKFLPSTYTSYEREIRKILIDNYFEAIIDIEIKTSLNLTIQTNTSLQINTPSQFSINVIIVLAGDAGAYSRGVTPCRFVRNLDTVIQPNFDSTNTTIEFEGFFNDIQHLLDQIMVDLKNVTSCNGTITINDGLNPILDLPIVNISDYFEENKPPQQDLNTALQDEVSNIYLYTDTYFTILFNEKRFIDKDLQYSLESHDDSPWITLNGLSISGTPPSQFWPTKNITLQIKVSNEYKSVILPLTLEVRWGLEDVFTKLIKVAGLIGSWVYFYLLLNIFCKRRYRYPKNYQIPIKKEISPGQILPIACVATEQEESIFIIGELKRSVAKNLKHLFISEAQLVEYFLDASGQQIEIARLIEAVEGVVTNLPKSKDHKVKYYASAGIRKDLIFQLVVNRLVMYQLNLQQEKLTKRIFEGLKGSWISLVQYEKGQPKWQLSINHREMERELQIRESFIEQSQESFNTKSIPQANELELSTVRVQKPQIAQNTLNDSKSDDTSSTNLERHLIIDDTVVSSKTDTNRAGKKAKKSQRLNTHLLQNALLAYAYTQQHLSINASKLSIAIKKKIDNLRWLPMVIARFFKLDLRTIHFATGDRIGYGIKYNLNEGVIFFSGVVDETFEKKTVVVQLNRRGRILRELWLHGIRENAEEKLLLNNEVL